MKKKGIVTFLILFVLLVIVGGGLFYFYKQPVGYVGIDINPSLQLAVNRLDRVVDVVPLNDDAELLVSDLNLVNMPVEEALETVVDSSIDVGYIDEFSEDNMVVIGASLDEEENVATLEKKLRTAVMNRLRDKKVPAMVLMEQDNKERRALADSYGVSYGSLLIAQKAVALNPDLNLDEIIKDPVNVNAKRMSDARKEIKQANFIEKKELIRAKKILKEQNLKQTEQRVQQMLKEAEQTREEITEENMEQYREQIVENKKEELMGKVEAVREQVEKKWSNRSNQSNDNQGNIEDSIPTEVQEKLENIKGKWNGKSR
ncbi:MAG: hypothetical protein PHS45_03100 [Bacilli bacterium]|nr:hypothetical protein [Bacilli bacterium]